MAAVDLLHLLWIKAFVTGKILKVNESIKVTRVVRDNKIDIVCMHLRINGF